MDNNRAVILFLCLLQWVSVYSHPNGSPVCDATEDEMRKMSEPTTDPSGEAFAIDVRQKSGDVPDYEIRLLGDNYTGFLLYVEDDSGSRIGSWKSAKFLKAVNNKDCNDGSTITQVNRNPKTKETVFTWTAPQDHDQGAGVVKAAIVVSMKEWYILQQPL